MPMKFVLVLFCLIFGSVVSAQKEAPAGHALMSPAELDLKIKAKKRLYPGGADEESLKVQPQLPQVSRKMAPVTDAPMDEEPEPSNEGM